MISYYCTTSPTSCTCSDSPSRIAWCGVHLLDRDRVYDRYRVCLSNRKPDRDGAPDRNCVPYRDSVFDHDCGFDYDLLPDRNIVIDQDRFWHRILHGNIPDRYTTIERRFISSRYTHPLNRRNNIIAAFSTIHLLDRT